MWAQMGRQSCLRAKQGHADDCLPEGSPASRGLELNLDLYGVCRKPGDSPPELVLEMRKVMEATRQKRLGLVEARSILLRMVDIADVEALHG